MVCTCQRKVHAGKKGCYQGVNTCSDFTKSKGIPQSGESPNIVDLLLMGVLPEYRSKGVWVGINSLRIYVALTAVILYNEVERTLRGVSLILRRIE